MREIGADKITIYNHTLYAYMTMLRQFSARHSDSTLTTASSDIENIYENLSKTESIKDSNVEEISKGVKALRICAINLQITICNKKYSDISPICEALALFIRGVEQDIAKAKEVAI